MQNVNEYFEDLYGRSGRYWWNVPYAYSTTPEELAPSLLGQATLRFAHARPPGRAIDIGSGEGIDAVRLARLGWHVEALEPTSSGCRKIQAAARSMNVEVIVHQASIDDFDEDGLFDIVVCNGVLHYIADKDSACYKLQKITSPGGANIISLWSDHSAVPECHKVVPVYPDAEYGSVLAAYASWRKELLYFERGKLETAHDDMAPHIHSHIKMVAVGAG